MIEITKSFIACTECPRTLSAKESMYENEPSAEWPHVWIPPRGWGGSSEAGHRPIMTVALNPGHPVEGELMTYAKAGVHPFDSPRDVSEEHASVILDCCTRIYEDGRRDKDRIYHRKVMAYVRASMWLISRIDDSHSDMNAMTDDWKNYAWMTDAFKCTTKSESGPRIPDKWMSCCVQKHLRNEIRLRTPRVVLALGKSSSRALEKNGIEHVELRHPSNGCAAIHSGFHDRALVSLAGKIGSHDPEGLVHCEEFRAFRKGLQLMLFSRSQ